MATAFKKVLQKKRIQDKQEDSDLEGSQSSEAELAPINPDDEVVSEQSEGHNDEPLEVDPVSIIY